MWSAIAKVYEPIKIGSIDGTDTEPHDNGIVRALNANYTPNQEIESKPECSIFIGRLDKKTTTAALKDFFSLYGRIRRTTLVKDVVTGESKGYAFIEFDKERSAIDAVEKAGGRRLDGKAILVDHECGRTLPGWRPRRLGGGFGGKKESGQLRFGCIDRPFRRPIVPVILPQKLDTETRKSRDSRLHRITKLNHLG